MADDFNVITRKTWQDIRTGTAFEQPEQDTGEYTLNFYGTRSNEGIKYDQLVSFIIDAFRDPNLIFNWADFDAPDTVSYYSSVTYGGPMLPVINSKPFVYINEEKKKIVTNFSGKLNKRIDYLEGTSGYIIKIDAAREIIIASLQIYYENTKQYRADAGDTINPNDFRINDKYVAIELTTKNLTDFCYLLKSILGNTGFETIKRRIAEEYAGQIKKIAHENEAVFLYSNIPEFAFNYLSGLLSSNQVFEHLALLKNYDDTGIFSGFVDSSGAIINLLRVIGNAPELYFKLLDNPLLVKELYINLDSTSIFGGIEQDNRSLFASFLTALCLNMQFEGQLKVNENNEPVELPTFYIGGNFKLDSNVDSDKDQYQDKIFLKQQLERTKKFQRSFSNSAGIPTSNTIEDSYTYKVDIGKGSYFYPLQPVKLINADIIGLKDDQNFIVVPAIFVKAISDNAEWEEINRDIRIGANILAIVLGLITLGSSSVLMTTLAVIDITVSMSDIAIQSAKEDIEKLEGGKEFLDIWDKILLAGGIAAAPLALKSAFTLGAKVFSRATLEATKEFISIRLAKIILEMNIANFTGNTVKVLANGVEVYDETLRTIKILEATELQKAGVIFVKGEMQIGNSVKTGFAVMHDGELIASGTAKEVRESLKDIITLKGEKLSKALLGIPKLNEKGFWQFINKAGNKMEWRNQLLRPKDLENSINNALSTGGAKGWEAEVAREISKFDDVTDFNNNVHNLTGNNIAGDIDIGTNKYFVECKESLNWNSINEKFKNQFLKYIDSQNLKFLNPKNKKVILAIKKLDNPKTLSHPILKDLRKKGLIVISDIKQLKKLK